MTPVLYRLFASGISQRRAALLLKLNRKTVVRQFRAIAEEARGREEKTLRRLKEDPRRRLLDKIQFDDLETSEHTKCKPLSVSLAVDPQTRQILGYEVSKMPAKGHLASIARKKYGSRPDERMTGLLKLMHRLKPVVNDRAEFISDENPLYPKALFHHHPHAQHRRVKGGRGAITGQGELKKLKFDPLFSLNHTCAMLRANLNRLFRRTWCTTKTRQGLEDHLALYVRFHNEVLTAPHSRTRNESSELSGAS